MGRKRYIGKAVPESVPGYSDVGQAHARKPTTRKPRRRAVPAGAPWSCEFCADCIAWAEDQEEKR